MPADVGNSELYWFMWALHVLVRTCRRALWSCCGACGQRRAVSVHMCTHGQRRNVFGACVQAWGVNSFWAHVGNEELELRVCAGVGSEDLFERTWVLAILVHMCKRKTAIPVHWRNVTMVL